MQNNLTSTVVVVISLIEYLVLSIDPVSLYIDIIRHLTMQTKVC